LSELKKKTLIILRHAHRDKEEGPFADNGLSEKGKKQAEQIQKYFSKQFNELKPVILSSPKLRCQETVAPLAEAARVPVTVNPSLAELDESTFEGPEEMAKRIEQFIHDWKKSKTALTVACSHGDWIPVALQLLVGKSIDLKKGAWAEVICEKDNRFSLGKVIQSFD
jgi:broad specificity phosphatase PhoE